MVRPTYDIPQRTIIFTPQSEASLYLCEQDEDMAAIIDAVGEVRLDIEADGFISLARAICDQQISIHAAKAIWGRLVQRCEGEVSAETLSLLDED